MRLSSALMCALVGLSLARAASAQPPSDDARRAARELADKGYEAMEARRYADAIDYFEKAEARVHATTFVVFMAEAQERLGKLVGARALYDRAATEALAPDAPPAFRDAQRRAREKLATLDTRIPRLVITSRAPQVTVDGAPVSPQEARRGVLLDPGTHAVVASDGARTVTRSVVVVEGRTSSLELQLPDGSSPVAPPATVRQRGSLVPAIVAFGVASVAAGVTIATGAVVLGKKSDVDEQCARKQCPADVEETVSSAKTFGTVSTVAFVVGVVAAGTGVALLVIRPGGSSGSARVEVGPGRVVATGTF